MSSKEVFLIKYLPTVTAFEDSFLFLLCGHWAQFLSCPYIIWYRTHFPRKFLHLGLCLLYKESFLNL